MHLFQLFSVITINSCILTIHGFNINATGGSFPSTLYRDATFAYQFLSSGDFVTYFGSSSTTGKCNIMGYWHNGDTLQSQSSIPIATKNRDTLICTDLCTVAVCGVSSAISPRFDRDSRSPLIDFAGSDSLLQASDYAAFPDLQMLPALAGATVPVYNIPDLSTSNISLTLSRQNIADIFKGKILYWNDSRILLSNPLVKGILSSIKLPIKVVVRTDSSGTSEIFTRALSLFDLKGISSPDYSFGATIRSGPTPSWCGLLTDEVQIITIGNCNSSLPTIDKVIHMKVLDKNRSLRNLRFMCDASAQNITTEFLKSSPGPGISVIVQKDIDRSGMINFQIGYSDASTIGIMWYKPSITYASPSLSVSIKTLQEGGYQNSHFSGVSFVTPQIQSIWVSSSEAFFQFIVTITNSNKSYDITFNSETTAIGMRTAFNNIINGCVTSVEHIDPELLSTWIEYRITFSDTCSSTISELKVHPFLNQNTDSVYVMTMQDYNNYPQFYDDLNPRGYGRSGR